MGAEHHAPVAQKSRRSLFPTPRRPALLIACALAAGICADQFLSISIWFWLLASVAVLVASAASGWKGSLGTLSALALIFLAGGARSHLVTGLGRTDNIAAFAESEPVTVRLRGVISSPVEIIDATVGPQIPPWMEIDRSQCTLRCEALESSAGDIPVSGEVRLEVTGHLVDARVADRVRLIGQFAVPSPPANPGGLDYRNVLRQQDLSGIVRCDHPANVRSLGAVPGLWGMLQRFRDAARRECARLLTVHLPQRERALAISLLIGERTGLDETLRTRFSESGTMHLLAISGVHVSILYGLVWMLCRVLNLSSFNTFWVMLLTVACYTFIADHRPPVMRAAVLAAMSLLGTVRGRQTDGMHLLACSALLLLLWHPLDLFDAGAQLSYLAVGALIGIEQFRAGWRSRQALAEDLTPERGAVATWFLRQGRQLGWASVVTGYVWLVTLPVTVSVFHLAAPIGLVANLALIPYSTLVLALGFAFLWVGLLLPWLAGVIAVPFSWSLTGFAAAVDWAGSVDAGHTYLPNFPVWWHLLFYAMLATSWGWLGAGRLAMLGLRGWLVCLWIGAALPLLPITQDSLRCTFLSVGHGLAVVIELPSGPTLLYDAGTLGDGRRAERAVENYLWSRGRSTVDVLLVTHADHDHFSGAFGLMEKLSVGQLCLPQTALGASGSGIAELCERAAARRIPIHLIQAGDQLVSALRSSPEVRMDVLHPQGGFRSREDNANSAVLKIEFAGRSLLLTGDLERDGLQTLLNMPAERVDVLLAPHHGGTASNVPALYGWARPDWVIASTGQKLAPGLPTVIGAAQLLSTATSGAVTVTISPSGDILVTEHAPREESATR